jgi:hypothetical protein
MKPEPGFTGPLRVRRKKRNEEKHGCQMAYFQTKNTNLGKFGKALEWKMLVYFMVVWNVLRPFGIFNRQLVI